MKISSDEVNAWLETLNGGLRSIARDEPDDLGMIGIMTGGVTVAKFLHKRLNLSLPLGHLNISFYRDDFSRIGLHPVVGASDIPFTVENKHIILVDDVLHTGRTIKAALNEVFDYGRPAKVTLAVLVDREGRELPIQPDYTGHTINLQNEQQIKLNIDTMECVIGNPRDNSRDNSGDNTGDNS